MNSEKNEIEFEQVKNPDSTNNWLLSFADLASLILTFFVLLYSMREIQQSEWEEMAKSISTHFHEKRQQNIVKNQDEVKIIPKIEVPIAANLGYILTILEERLKTYEWYKDVAITDVGDKLYISLAGDLVFAPGGVELSAQSKEIIEAVSLILGTLGNHIEVVGNSDPTPVTGGKFPSNWELSMQRARIVADKMRAGGYIYAIDVNGRGSAHFEATKNDAVEKDRYKLARRIDIVITGKSAAMVSN